MEEKERNRIEGEKREYLRKKENNNVNWKKWGSKEMEEEKEIDRKIMI